MIKEDGHVLHFTSPKVQASLTANTFAITGNCEEKREPLLMHYSGSQSLFISLCSFDRDAARFIQSVGD